MGMTIDNSCEPKLMSKEEIVDTLKTMVFGVKAFERFNAKEREALDKSWNMIDQYEARLKADMVAMLTDMKDELKHCEITGLWKANYREGFNDGVSKSLDVIQQKINELKEIKDDKYKPLEKIK